MAASGCVRRRCPRHRICSGEQRDCARRARTRTLSRHRDSIKQPRPWPGRESMCSRAWACTSGVGPQQRPSGVGPSLWQRLRLGPDLTQKSLCDISWPSTYLAGSESRTLWHSLNALHHSGHPARQYITRSQREKALCLHTFIGKEPETQSKVTQQIHVSAYCPASDNCSCPLYSCHGSP